MAQGTARERILGVLTRGKPICDDCLVGPAELSARQQAYQVLTPLGREGAIGRGKGTCGTCGKHKTVSVGSRSPVTTVTQPEPRAASTVDPSERPWYWEGAIQSRVVTFLAQQGYEILAVADTAARAAGKDIRARGPDGRELWVTVKGWPERSQNVQARHWFSGALFDIVLYRGEARDANLAMALPDGYSTYLNLAPRVAWLKEKVPFRFLWVAEDGSVRTE